MPKRSPTFAKGIECRSCGAVAVKTGAMQKYCIPCSEKRADDRRCAWGKAHPPSSEAMHRRNKKTQASYIETGRKISAAAKSSITVNMTRPVLGDLLVRVKIPFSYSASKNAIYSLAKGGGHVFKRKAANQYRAALTLALRNSLRGNRFYNNKIWLDILVQKPNHKGDAVNVVDLVCDAAKDAFGVDDRWFSIRRLDWQITKEDGQLIVGALQEDMFDAQVCSYCGRTLALDQFWKSKRLRFGVSRCCKDCGRAPTKRVTEWITRRSVARVAAVA